MAGKNSSWLPAAPACFQAGPGWPLIGVSGRFKVGAWGHPGHSLSTAQGPRSGLGHARQASAQFSSPQGRACLCKRTTANTPHPILYLPYKVVTTTAPTLQKRKLRYSRVMCTGSRVRNGHGWNFSLYLCYSKACNRNHHTFFILGS